MERIVELGNLLDCYGALLTERQRTLLFQQVCEDCSLSEIAEREGISRQAVRDAIVSGERQLRQYEEALGLCQRLIRFKKASGEAAGAVRASALPEREREALLLRVNEMTRVWEE